MVLVDTSVWVEHLRNNSPQLADLLENGLALTHPFVVGELACDGLKNRTALLASIKALPTATMATDEEVLHLIEDRRIWGRGIGWVDAHLLASALLSRCSLWALDARLQRLARELGA